MLKGLESSKFKYPFMATIAEIIHLSEVDFGPNNITQVVGPTSKPRNLAELVLRDLKQPPPPLPMVGPEGIILETPPRTSR